MRESVKFSHHGPCVLSTFLSSFTSIFIPFFSTFLLPLLMLLLTCPKRCLIRFLRMSPSLSPAWRDLCFEKYYSQKGLSFCKRACQYQPNSPYLIQVSRSQVHHGKLGPSLFPGDEFLLVKAKYSRIPLSSDCLRNEYCCNSGQ